MVEAERRRRRGQWARGGACKASSAVVTGWGVEQPRSATEGLRGLTAGDERRFRKGNSVVCRCVTRNVMMCQHSTTTQLGRDGLRDGQFFNFLTHRLTADGWVLHFTSYYSVLEDF